jgi:hypothetical protein
MRTIGLGAASCAALFLVIASRATAEDLGDTVHVNCGGKPGFASIGAALKALQSVPVPVPVTINVSGACHENVLIQNMDRLTIAGSNSASITDASGGAADVIDIRNSRVTITGMTISGQNGVNNDAVDCEAASQCTLIENTIQGDADAVGIYNNSSATIVGGILQNNTSAGIGIYTVADVLAAGVTIQGNPIGVIVHTGGRARLTSADPGLSPVLVVTPTTVANNGTGIDVSAGGQFICSGCVVRNNSADGIHADISAVVALTNHFLANGSSFPPSVSGNAGHGVYIGDLSSGTFRGTPSTVFGNAQPDILCNSPTSVSRGALAAANGAAHTNCAY